jgi:hypothetical protein
VSFAQVSHWFDAAPGGLCRSIQADPPGAR